MVFASKLITGKKAPTVSILRKLVLLFGKQGSCKTKRAQCHSVKVIGPNQT